MTDGGGVLVGDLQPEALGDEESVAPHLIDREVTHVLRRLAHGGDLTGAAATAAMTQLLRVLDRDTVQALALLAVCRVLSAGDGYPARAVRASRAP